MQIAKPEASSLISGVSAAFYTHGTITNDALLVEKVINNLFFNIYLFCYLQLALHITVGNNAKLTTQTSSVSGQFAMLRSIFKYVKKNANLCFICLFIFSIKSVNCRS